MKWYNRPIQQTYFTIDKKTNRYKNVKEEKHKMKIEVQEGKEFEPIEDGLHKGGIVDVEVNERKGYKYIDLHIACDDKTKDDGTPITIKASYPAKIIENSMTWKLLERLDKKPTIGQAFDTDDLKGTYVQYQTVSQESNGKTYANILRETVKKTNLD